jgi:hypothetical protein
MQSVTIDDATKRLAQELKLMPLDDLVAIHNEMWMSERINREDVGEDAAPVLARIMAHLRNGLAIDELIDLWNVVFPKERARYYDEEDGALCCREENEPYEYAD